MGLAELCILGVAVVLATERNLDRCFFAVVALQWLVGALVLLTGDLDRAVILAALSAGAIVGASRMKWHHSSQKLTVADCSLLFAGTIPFMIAQYPRAALLSLAASGAVIALSIFTLMSAGGAPLGYNQRLVIFAVSTLAAASAYVISDRSAAFRLTTTQRKGFFSTFMASLFDVRSWWSSRGLRMTDIADVSLPLLAAAPSRTAARPDIIVIQHESVFDPRLFGLPVEPGVAAFLAPPKNLCGRLNVDIYGGGSWQTEFSLLTGLSSASFGADAYFILTKGIGRFHHTLPTTLTAQGYETLLTSSCRRDFLNYDAFYRSVGVNESRFSDDFFGPRDIKQFEQRYADAEFLPLAFDTLKDRMAASTQPQFMMTLTNFNHGPHTRQAALPVTGNSHRDFAYSTLPDAQYAEYYARLAETATTWERLKRELVEQFPDRPMLIVHYGDHQPVMTRRIALELKLDDDERRQFRTFYAIEGLNFEIDRAACSPGPVLDVALLGTVAMQAAGLSLDAISVTRASLMEDCSAAYFVANSDRKRRFHRTLVNLGMIDLAPLPQPIERRPGNIEAR